MTTTELPLACCKSPVEPYTPVCPHMVYSSTRKSEAKFYFRFNTRCPSYEVVCEECGATGAPATHVYCFDCIDPVVTVNQGARRSDIYPEVIDKAAGLSVEVSPLLIEVDIEWATAGGARNEWFAVTRGRQVIRFSGDDRHYTKIADLQSFLSLEGPLGIRSDRAGNLVAVFEEFDSSAVVLDVQTGKVLMSLDRGRYHTEHCCFPLAFFEYDGRTLLVHATEWNRVDVSDPRTGERLTERASPRYEGKTHPIHYLDYFYCALAVSPNAKWIASDGWVWGPWGGVRCWSLSAWLNENVWESEDGPSARYVCGAHYFWNRPLCWIDERTIAWWGLGHDDLATVPAIVFHDVEQQSERALFPGPFIEPPPCEIPRAYFGNAGKAHRSGGDLLFDRWLFAWKPGFGLTAWDINDGCRVLRRPNLLPVAYSRSRREFLCRHKDSWSVARVME